MLKGIGTSKGYGIGKIVLISDAKPSYIAREVSDVEAEKSRYDAAVKVFIEKTKGLAEAMRERVGDYNAEILESHILLLTDPGMEELTKNAIQEGSCAEAAFDATCDMFAHMFMVAEDELTKQRATDIQDIKSRMLKILTGEQEVDISAVPAGTILVAEDFTPSMTAGIVKENVEGILTAVGGKTSHSAILARSLEIPAVMSIDGILDQVSDGMTVILDGQEGICILEPSEAQLKEYRLKKFNYLKDMELLKQLVGQKTKMRDGTEVDLFGNIGNPNDAKNVLEGDGEGIGLFRTEFLFMGAKEMPSEEQQFEAYKTVALTMKDKSVIIRTLDVGGDKEIPYLGMEKEENPFLGFRAIRYCLQNEEMYRTQLRALLRASAYGDIKIMVPLVTSVDEIRRVKELVSELKLELKSQSIAFNDNIQVGVMMETAAASLLADLLAKEADFFSIGTNDLTQYTMAVDRGNAKVAYLYSTYHPAVLRSIKNIILNANQAGIMVGMCGEAAADPLMIPLLLSFGLKEFSVGASSILSTRSEIAKWTMEEVDEITKKAMELTTEKEVEEYLKSVCK